MRICVKFTKSVLRPFSMEAKNISHRTRVVSSEDYYKLGISTIIYVYLVMFKSYLIHTLTVKYVILICGVSFPKATNTSPLLWEFCVFLLDFIAIIWAVSDTIIRFFKQKAFHCLLKFEVLICIKREIYKLFPLYSVVLLSLKDTYPQT